MQKYVIYLFSPTVCEILEDGGVTDLGLYCEHLAEFLAHVSSVLVSSGRKEGGKRQRSVCGHLNTAARQRSSAASGHKMIDQDQ